MSAINLFRDGLIQAVGRVKVCSMVGTASTGATLYRMTYSGKVAQRSTNIPHSEAANGDNAMTKTNDKYALLEQVEGALEQIERIVQNEREIVRRMEAEMREADAAMERELQRLIDEHNTRRMRINSMVADVKSRISKAQDSAPYPPMPQDMPQMQMPRVLGQQNNGRK